MHVFTGFPSSEVSLLLACEFSLTTQLQAIFTDSRGKSRSTYPQIGRKKVTLKTCTQNTSNIYLHKSISNFTPHWSWDGVPCPSLSVKMVSHATTLRTLCKHCLYSHIQQTSQSSYCPYTHLHVCKYGNNKWRTECACIWALGLQNTFDKAMILCNTLRRQEYPWSQSPCFDCNYTSSSPEYVRIQSHPGRAWL